MCRALLLLLLTNATFTFVTQMAEFTKLQSGRKLALGTESQGHIFTKCRINMLRTADAIERPVCLLPFQPFGDLFKISVLLKHTVPIALRPVWQGLH